MMEYLTRLFSQAEAEGIELNHFEVIPRKNVGLDVHLKKFPLGNGKIPGLEGPGIEITETLAIAVVSGTDVGLLNRAESMLYVVPSEAFEQEQASG